MRQRQKEEEERRLEEGTFILLTRFFSIAFVLMFLSSFLEARLRAEQEEKDRKEREARLAQEKKIREKQVFKKRP